MPLINVSEPEKIFQGTRTRIHAPKLKHVKKNSAETLKSFSVQPYPPPPPPVTKYMAGAVIPNSTVKKSLLKLNENNRTKDALRTSHKNEFEIDQESSEESSTSTLESNFGLNTVGNSNSRILELKSRHQKLLSSAQIMENDIPIYEPRRPTMEAIREAIEKAKLLEINRHKNVGTSDDAQSLTTSNVSTSTDTRKRRKKKSISPKLKRTENSLSSTGPNSATKNKPKKKKNLKNDEKISKSTHKKKP